MSAKHTLLIASCICALPANAQTDSIQADTAAVQLKEVVVKANKVRVFADHDEMTLSDENKNFGANAIDAISSLPAFRTQINANEILNLKNEKVTVVINNQVVTSDQLASYQGNEIKAVKYYPITPARYKSFTSGPVIVAELQKPRDAYVSLRLTDNITLESSCEHILDFVNDNAGANFNYMDSLNMIRFSYSYGYTNRRHKRSSIINECNGSRNQYLTDRGRLSSQNHILFANYQYSNPTNLFSVILSYGKTPYSRAITPMRQDIDGSYLDDARVTSNDRESDVVKGGLFYDHSFENKSRLSLQAQGSITWTDSRQALREIGLDGNDFSSLSHDNNRVLSGVFYANYSLPLRKGDFNVFAISHINHINKRFNGKEMPVGNDVSFYLSPDYSITINKLHLSINPSYTFSLNCVADGQRMENHIPTGTLSLAYKVNDRIRISASGVIGTSYRTLGSMYGDNKYYDSENYYQVGNFDVKPSHQYSGSIDVSYYSPSGNLSVGADVFYRYATNPFYQYVLKDGKDFVQTSLNAKRDIQAYTSVYGSYKPFKWLEAYVYASLMHYKNPLVPIGPDKYLAHNNFSLTFQLTAKHRNLYATASFQNGSKMYQGDLITDKPLSAQAQVGWRHAGLYAGFGWFYNFSRQKETMKADGFLWEQFSPTYTRNVFGLSLTYAFSHGVYKQKERKSLSVSGDSGLLRE